MSLSPKWSFLFRFPYYIFALVHALTRCLVKNKRNIILAYTHFSLKCVPPFISLITILFPLCRVTQSRCISSLQFKFEVFAGNPENKKAFEDKEGSVGPL
jgi:hypothetical protein